MTERTCTIEWKNNVSDTFISREIPHIYEMDRADAERMLNRGYVVCITPYSDIAFMSVYSNRSHTMAQAGETLVYPCGQVITIRNKAE